MADISRRTLFNRGLLVLAVGGGGLFGLSRTVHHKVAVPPGPPPTALTAALEAQRRLLSGYDTVGSSARPELVGLRRDVAAHGDALRGLLEFYPGWRLGAGTSTAPPGGTASTSAPATTASSGTTSSTVAPDRPVPATIAELAIASRQASLAAAHSCAGWREAEPNAAQVVPVLGSISACLATHGQVLG